MKRTITTFITSAMLAMTFVPASTSISHAQAATNTYKINYDGFQKCKALGNSGFTALVRGESTYRSGSGGSFGKFKVRTCFKTKAECKSFINGGIGKILLGISEIDHTSCRSRGS